MRVKVISRRTDLSDEMNREIDIMEAMIYDHDRFLLNIALSYGGRAEIIDAVKEVANQVKAGDLNINDIDEARFAEYLYTQGVPDFDLNYSHIR